MNLAEYQFPQKKNQYIAYFKKRKYIDILKQFNILIFKYFPYLKILNIFKYLIQ